jgi:hypothetical protein
MQKQPKSFYSELTILVITLKRDGRSRSEGESVKKHALRRGQHTVSMLTDHLVFSPKYRGTVLLGDVAEAAEEIIDEEKDKSFKTGYITLYTKLFHAHRSRFIMPY